MRALWGVPEDKLLVGVDADGIQLRVLAHYMNDKEFTEALVNGRKKMLPMRIASTEQPLRHVCKGPRHC